MKPDFVHTLGHTLLALIAILPLAASAGELRPNHSSLGTTRLHRPGQPDAYIADLQNARRQILNSAAHRAVIDKTHRALYATWPIYFDWWLQDGDDLQWYTGNLADQLAIRMRKLNGQSGWDSTTDNIESGMRAYLSACETRRGQRLQKWINRQQPVIFIKHRPQQPARPALGSQMARFWMKGPWAEEQLLIDSPDGLIRDPDIHSDGSRLLFSWKKTAKHHLRIHEMNLVNWHITPLTDHTPFETTQPIYLPDGNILFTSARSGNPAEPTGSLHLLDPRRHTTRRIGFDPIRASDPSVLSDGRVIYTRWDYDHQRRAYALPLYQINPDGTGQTSHYAADAPHPVAIIQARQIPGTRRLIATIPSSHHNRHGKLGIINPEADRVGQEGILLVAPLRVPKAGPSAPAAHPPQTGEQYQHPYPLDKRELLVSCYPLGETGGPAAFAIYWMQLDGQRELLLSHPSLTCSQPVIAAPRGKPFRRASAIDPDSDTATCYIQDIHAGHGLQNIPRGNITQLRINQLIRRDPAQNNSKTLGVIDIHPDGSARFQTPAHTPVHFQALDRQGRVVQTMHSWITLQPGETRNCVGCHQPRHTAPRAPLPETSALKHPVQQINRTPDGNTGRLPAP